VHQATTDRLIRRPEVRAQTGLSDSGLDREVHAGRFPRPVSLTPDPRCRAVGWSERAVQAWVADRIAASREVAA